MPLGIGSLTRKTILSDESVSMKPIAQHRVFRALLRPWDVSTDSVASKMFEARQTNTWIGPSRHVIGYPIQKGQLYNLVLMHAGEDVKSQQETPDAEQVRNQYQDFDLGLREVLNEVREFGVWDALYLPMLPRWSSSDGRVVLVGDSAHAMLPYAAQVEDAL